MENNNQIDELLIRYLEMKLDPAEKLVVEEWINSNEINRLHFNSLQKVRRLTAAKHTLDYVIDVMNVDDKWNSFKQNITARKTKTSIIDSLKMNLKENMSARRTES